VRARESHGINLPVLEQLINQGVELLLTCDTGISAHEALDYAQSRAVPVLVTDHHDLPPSLPNALALVNPKRLPEDHPLATLPGVGVAYKLAEELYRRAGRPEASAALLDLVALGIVADLALLSGETRYLLQCGLQALRQTRRLGLQAMLELAEIAPQNLAEEHISFVLGPRLNALGRLADANRAIELLTTQDMGRARILALELEGLNAERKLLTDQVFQAAQAQIEADRSLLDEAALVLAHPAWPGGVVGIVASRLVEYYHRPVVLLSAPPGQLARGSARSVEGINITAAIAANQRLLNGFGGHPMAAGYPWRSSACPKSAGRCLVPFARWVVAPSPRFCCPLMATCLSPP
jgi:single-stranded-DNA-specific exonuclease